MTFFGPSRSLRRFCARFVRPARSPWSLALWLVSCLVAAGCQKEDDHPAYAAGCQSDCTPFPPIGIGVGASAGGAGGGAATDAGFDAGTLRGTVSALIDDSFSRATAFTRTATITADGASGSPVTGTWNGMDPFALSGVSIVPTNWLRVAPGDVQGDALPTVQAVQTNATDTADLVVINAAAIDAVLNAVSATRAPALGQVVLFFRNAGTGVALSGIRATMALSAAEATAYAAGTATGWVIQDDTTVTNASGLVVFGNVTLPTGGNTTQTVTVSRPATATTPAIAGGQFAVRVVEGAVTLASVSVKL